MASLAQSAPAQNLAQCRRNRKREMDRICQQRKRKRDRDNLEKLENSLQLLQENKQNALLAQLMKDRDENEARNIRHRKRLLQIRGLLQADLADLGHSETTTSPSGDRDALQTRSIETNSSPADDLDFLNQTSAECHDETITFGCENDLNAVHEFDIDDFGAIGPESDEILWPQQVNEMESEHVNSGLAAPETVSVNNGRQRKVWEEVEQLIARAKPSSSSPGTDNLELDVHIIINAVARGWSQFSRVVSVDVRWSCLRELDEKYFSQSYGQVERLAVLAIASQLIEGNMMSNSVGSQLLPPFLKPRPSQLAIPHSVIADFYVWPGLRERLSVCQHYYSDSFLHSMYMMFQFIWPYDLKATYNINPQTGLFHFSARFMEHFQNIRCWTMNSDFLVKYPDFQGDVPIWNTTPSGPLSTGVSYSEWYHFNTPEEEEASRNNLQLATVLRF